MIGKTMSHYKVLQKLGSGGMGEVYLAEDTKLKRKTVLKFLHPHLTEDKVILERFEREAQATAALNHPNIVTIYEIDQYEGSDGAKSQTFIAMEHVDGHTLKEEISEGPMEIDRAIDVALQLCEGLGEAHNAGIVHRDIKPENILIDKSGRVKILDFGLAQIRGATELTKNDSTFGTAKYMSPEQYKGEKVDHLTDIWSLGVLLYEMLTGKIPFEGDFEAAVMYSVLNDTPDPLIERRNDMPVELANITNKALEKDPKARISNTQEIVKSLKKIRNERTAGPASESMSKELKPKIRKEIVWGAALVMFIVVVVVRLVIMSQNEKIESIAVLPLENLSDDLQQVYFCDGITDALITELGKIEALRVTSRTSAYRFRDSDRTLPEIARELKVDAVVEGSVLQAETEIRIDVKLIDAAEDRQIWADHYERALENVLVLQSEVVQDIARRIRVAVTPEERARLTSRETINPDAHEAYLRGKHLLAQRKTELIYRAIEHFQEAIRIDSVYAYGYLGLADANVNLGFWNILPPLEIWPKAHAMAEKALAIDETLAEAHAVFALAITKYEYDWARAEEEFQVALEINPNSAEIHMWYAQFLFQPMLRFEEALAHVEIAQKLDPFSLEVKTWESWIKFASGDTENALKQMEGLNASFPEHPFFYWSLAFMSATQEKYEKSLEYLKESIRFSGEYIINDIAVLSYLYTRVEQLDQAMDANRELEALSARGKWVSPVTRSFYYIGLGEKDRAIDWIEIGYETHDTWMQSLNSFFIFNSLRDHPRFMAILEKMGLEP